MGQGGGSGVYWDAMRERNVLAPEELARRYWRTVYGVALSLTGRAGRNAYKEFVENALSVVRDREEVFLRIRYTF